MKNSHIILFILGVFSILAVLSSVFPREGVTFTLHFPQIEDMMSFSSSDSIVDIESNLASLESDMQVVVDTLEFTYENADSLACIDTLNYYKAFDTTSKIRLYFPDNDPSIMDTVFATLETGRKRNTVMHIIHYGDSQIEIDRISGYIRQALQEKFGGRGAGLLPIVPLVPTTPVGQKVSDSLPRYVASGTMRQRLPHNRYGVLAQMAELRGTVTLKYTARDWKQVFPLTKKFSRVRLLFGESAEHFKATLSAAGQDSTYIVEESVSGLKELVWTLTKPVSECSLQLQGTAELYGVSLEGTSGVTVDNVPLRGSAGTFFTSISSSLLRQSYTTLHVPMIILEFGGNAVPAIHSLESVQNYKKDFSRQIRYLQSLYPKAFILVIGPADMSTKINGELQTHPYVEEVVEIMKEAAIENGAAFWNMYEVMGGRNSMIQWVSHSPAWAAPDYIHFSPQGARRIAEMFTESFMHYYDYYTFKRRNNIWLSQPDEYEEEYMNDTIEMSDTIFVDYEYEEE